MVVENLGQVVFGERIKSSPYTLEFMKDQKCAKVCTKSYKTSSKEDKKKLNDLKRAMNLNYYHHWIVGE
ncbi:Transmembrane 9 superfamily member 2 [Portunus trituberculatus]|uniref:Transmembrane 9 superfamily member n=1 Tax=Portunus trituberculatus TaxID=210409 RepID=A0A5B7JYV9_PORTR|nr:Transmembrane 9 superfamily member 2 [Portunus trituberculatus]